MLVLVVYSSLARSAQPAGRPNDSIGSDPTYLDGVSAGRADARTRGAPSWAVGGAISGIAVPILAPAAVVTLAAVTDQPIPERYLPTIEARPLDFQEGYVDGYQKVRGNRQVVAALCGGVVGSALGIGMYLALATVREPE